MRKNIVICCDGTGNEYGEQNTNVVKLFESLDLSNPSKQIGYYDPGVGTFSSPAAITKTAKWLSKLWGLAFASGITRNIEDAYEYLMNKYVDGDRVYLFGFSRGAFTVRALAGMLCKCGLLQKGSNNLIPYATNMYRRGKPEVAVGFKKTFSRECKPHFIGVWDTVKSVGLFVPRKFPNAKLNPDVKYGYQALAIDEKRSKFRPNLWDPPESSDQVIEQVWFAGVHCDIGGSYSDDGLSNIALQWLAQRAESCELNIRKAELARVKTDPCDKLHNSLLPIWWLLGWKRRNIENGSKIHTSIVVRIEKCNLDYMPKNLPALSELEIVNDE
jgi:uncharacterized protein (DUF2235 family)